MFGNANKKVGEIDKTVNNRIEDEQNSPVNGPNLNIGNQENLINADLLNISNEYNNQIFEGDKPENETDESADEAEKLFAESRKYLIERGYLDEEKAPDVMNNGFSGQLPGLGQTKKKDLFDDIDIDDSLAYYRNNDLNNLDKAGKGKQNIINKNIKKKPKKTPEKIVNEGIPEKEEDLTQVDESLEPVNGLNFKMRKHPERMKPSAAKKMLSWLAYYGGKFAGKLIGGFLTVLNAITGGKVTGSNTFRGWIN